MRDTFADDAGQLANLAAFRGQLQQRDFPAAQTGLAPESATLTDSVAGPSACRSCHEKQYAVWSTSLHAQAWKTLLAKGTQVDPACQVCHTTAYGLPGGFASLKATPDRVNVSCEDCHGPSARHVKEPKIKTLYGSMPRDCRTCHDAENSPHFEFNQFYSKIQHADKKEPKP